MLGISYRFVCFAQQFIVRIRGARSSQSHYVKCARFIRRLSFAISNSDCHVYVLHMLLYYHPEKKHIKKLSIHYSGILFFGNTPFIWNKIPFNILSLSNRNQGRIQSLKRGGALC